ncbi:MAG: ABC transporter ATP-binding protein [Bradymonadia bacterium]
MTSVLHFENISMRFGRGSEAYIAVDGFNGHVAQGEIVALVGASGSGKSTIARIGVGLETPTTGQVFLREANGQRKPTLKDVQMVFQDPFASLNPVHRIRTHLKRPLVKLTGRKHDSRALKHTLEGLLEQVGLTPASNYLDRFPASLSGGQRQRVAIARALAPAPTFMIADEPTAMLDVSIRNGVLKLFTELSAKGVGVLLITHDIGSVRSIANRVYVLQDGRVVESGETLSVLQKPRSLYARALFGSVPDPDGRFLEKHQPAVTSDQPTRGAE